MERRLLEKTFPFGKVIITSEALDQLHPEDLYQALQRNAAGDLGDSSRHDGTNNDLAPEEGSILVAEYRDRNQLTFRILTELDQSVTCVLLPDDD